jgi:hypothetical protein
VTLVFADLKDFTAFADAEGDAAAIAAIDRFGKGRGAGSLPLCATVIYLGGRLESLSPRDPALWLAIAVTLVLLAGGHLLARRRPAQTGSSTSGEPGWPASSSTASGSRPKASPQPHSQARASTSSSGPTAS